MPRLPRSLRRARRFLLARRRLLAACAAVVAVLALMQAMSSPPPPRTPVLTASHDIPAGAVVAADPQGGHAATAVARDVVVLAMPHTSAQAPGALSGALVLLGLPRADATSVAEAAVSAFLSVVLTR